MECYIFFIIVEIYGKKWYDYKNQKTEIGGSGMARKKEIATLKKELNELKEKMHQSNSA